MSLPEPLIDIGVNLTSSSFSKDLPAVLTRAEQARVQQMVLIGSDVDDSIAAVQLATQYPNLVTTAGIHPHHADSCSAAALDELQQLIATHPDTVKALGETGLDFNRNYSPPEDQLRAFEAQLKLAVDLGLPVYLHQRDAHEVFVDMLSRYRAQLSNAVLHCFTGTEAELEEYLDLDLHFGITGWICDERRGLALQKSVQHIPLNRIMLETDAPYLLPRTILPKPKSRRNEPARLSYVQQQVATCLNMNPDELAKITTQNAQRFFGL